MTDNTAAGFDKFPAPVYRETVLAPLFESSKRLHAAALFRVHYAHAVMLAEQNVVPSAEIDRILAALRDIERNFDLASVPYTGEHEDLFFVIEAELVRRLGPDLAGKLHTGRSRNDIDHTLFKMALKEHQIALFDRLHGLIAALLDVAEREKATLVVAYTHGQPAQPTTFGHYLCALAEILLRDIERITAAGRALDLCSMGAAAITTTGFPIERARVAALLGFAEAQENSYGCIAACDYATGVYAALKVMFVNIGRFVQDLGQWTGFETGHLRVPDGFVQISSIMPQKRNPVPVEHMRLMASLGAGHCDAVVNTMHNTPFTDMNDCETEVHAAGYQAFAAADRLLRLLADFVRAVQVDEARVRRHIDESCITITELADTLVRGENLSFRQAHEIAAHIARLAVDSRRPLSALPYADIAAIFAKATGRSLSLSEAALRHAATPENFVAVRERQGGPGPQALAASLARYRAALAARRQERAAMQRRVADAAKQLDALVDARMPR
ncbi:MAG: argininosuccinate lyase [Alphaproteobacteria bacterium]|nr:argininosuccinate lyase [Alphaproteobacteria bacterium]